MFEFKLIEFLIFSDTFSFISTFHFILDPKQVRLFGQGLDIVEVSDNGVGVPKASRPLLCTRYATSKLQNFEQLYSSTTSSSMGFRGEALFSLAALSQNVLICTKCEGEELAETMEFDRTGGLLPEKTQVQPRKVGTTVAVVKPFHSLPARRADLKRRIQRERQQLYKLMESCKYLQVLCLFWLDWKLKWKPSPE